MFIANTIRNVINNSNNSSGLSIPKINNYNNDLSVFSGILAMAGILPDIINNNQEEFGLEDKSEYDDITRKNRLTPHPQNVYEGKLSETFTDEEGYNCQKHINPDGTYTISRTEPVGFFQKLFGHPERKIIECYTGDGVLTKTTEYPNNGNTDFFTVTNFNEDGSIKSERQRFDCGGNIKAIRDKTTVYNNDGTKTVSNLDWNEAIKQYDFNASYYFWQENYDENGNKI